MKEFVDREKNLFFTQGLREEEEYNGEEEIDRHAAAPEMLMMTTAAKLKKEIEENPGKYVSPPGSLNLPPLVDKKRCEELIPDFFFGNTPTFDRIHVFQIDANDSETYEGTSIVKPVGANKRDLQECPRGILLNGGLAALDNLRSNGVDLGHTVSFIRQAPWRMKMGAILGHELYVLLLRDGDITGSDDLGAQTRSGEVKLETRTFEKGGVEITEHFYVDPSGKEWTATEPVISEDY